MNGIVSCVGWRDIHINNDVNAIALRNVSPFQCLSFIALPLLVFVVSLWTTDRGCACVGGRADGGGYGEPLSVRGATEAGGAVLPGASHSPGPVSKLVHATQVHYPNRHTPFRLLLT